MISSPECAATVTTTVHCLTVLRLLLLSCFSSSQCSALEPHLCSKQIKSTWSESLRESALILSWLCSLGETCQHNCCHKSRRTSATMPPPRRPRHHSTAAARRASVVTLASRGPYDDYYEKLQVKSNTIVQHSMALLYAFICQVIALLYCAVSAA